MSAPQSSRRVGEFGQATRIGWLCVVCISSLAPFAAKAFHIDDPLFIWTAQHVQAHPLDFYGFDVNWYGVSKPMSLVMKNPPLGAYFIALAALLFGWGELALHGALLLPAVAAVVGTYVLARDLCGRPMAAALTTLASPVFLLSSTGVMCDVLMLSFWVWAIYLWRRGLRTDSRGNLAVASLLIAACSLTKYFGMSLIPLLLVYSVMDKRKPAFWMPFLSIPILILAGYQWATYALYGKGLLLDAASYATSERLRSGGDMMGKLVTGTAFTGGCVIVSLLAAPLLWRKRILAAVLLAGCAVAAAVQTLATGFNFPPQTGGGVNWLFLVQLYVFLCSGLFAVTLIVAECWTRRDADAVMLFAWSSGTIGFATVVNWSVNGRSLLPLAPAFAILLARRLDRLKPASGGGTPLRWAWPIAAAGAVALAVTTADYRLANAARRAALEIHDAFRNEKGTVWFQGHWGFQYYMERAGDQPSDFTNYRVATGDIVLIPANNTNTTPLSPNSAAPVREFRYPTGGSVATMNRSAGAGFYWDGRGALPYAIAVGADETYGAFRVIR